MRSPKLRTLLKVAVQIISAVTVSVPLAQHVPVQPENVAPLDAVAVRTIRVPLRLLSLQSLPQLIPVALTVPLPVPALTTVKVNEARLNVAVQLMSRVTRTVPLLQPFPVQPANFDPFAGVAVSTMELPLAYFSLQSLPQLIPTAATVPLPSPVLFMVNPKLVVEGGDGIDAVVAHSSLEYPDVPAELYALTR